MALIKITGSKHRSTARVLADIAHELSSTSDWKSRLDDVLTLLRDIIPSRTVALGVSLDGWTVRYYPDPEDPTELAAKLLEHYVLLTGRSPSTPSTDLSDAGVISECGSENGSFLSLPVIGAGQVTGVLHVCIDEEDAYSAEDVSVLSVVALQIGSYVEIIQSHSEANDRARQMEALRDEAERRRAEMESFITATPDGVMLFDAEGGILLMNEAGRNILGAPHDHSLLDWASTLRRYTLDGDEMDAEESAPLRAFRGEIVRDARYRVVTRDGVSITLGISASPVRDSSGRVVGVVCVFRDISEEIDFQQRRQELLEREHHIAQMLQQALIPPQTEYSIETARIAVRYQSAMKEAEIGGDFYDVFRLSDNRIGILIGDVAGKGLSAAIRVAAVRYAVRSYAYLDSSPGVVLTLVNELLCRDEPGGAALMTAVYAVVDTLDCTLTYASGGHEPPLVRTADGRVEELSQYGQALGVDGGFTYTEASRSLRQGDMLVMVTDGIVEARSANVLFGPEGVEEFLRAHCGLSPSRTASGLMKAATDYAGGSLQDDAAIVVLELACK